MRSIILLLPAFFELFSLLSSCEIEIQGKKKTLSNWTWKTHDANNTYTLSFCTPIQPCNSGACMYDKASKKFTSVGGFPPDWKLAKFNQDETSFSILFSNGDLCPQNSTVKLSSQVNVFCGRTLGELEFVEQNGCLLVFDFATTEACATLAPKEIPCYIYNTMEEKIDLSPLIRTVGAYEVGSFIRGPQLYINICRGITSPNSTFPCPSESAACSNFTSFGQVTETGLSLSKDEGTVILEYTNLATNCSTKIYLMCPAGSYQGIPLMTKGVDGCNFEVHWVTEYACPVKDKTSASCKLDLDIGQFDLTPLQKNEDHVWTVSQADNSGKNYTLSLNVCANRGQPCRLDAQISESAVCQIDPVTMDSKSLGNTSRMSLRHVDNKLVLVYRDGDQCSSGIRRSTIITFSCDNSAGDGTPSFSHEEYCNYFINWPTRHACSHKRRMDTGCQFLHGSSIFDLTELTKVSGLNWNIIDERKIKSGAKYFLNVCGSLVNSDVSSNCSKNAAVCEKTSVGTRSLGEFSDPLKQLPDGSLQLIYNSGDQCANGASSTTTTVTFICYPGLITSSPQLVSSSSCSYNVEWATAFACPIKQKTGYHCEVEMEGLTFDLNPLKDATPSVGFYTVQSDQYDFQLKVCAGTNTTYCKTGEGKDTEVMGCQYKASDKTAHIMGLPDVLEEVHYWDGFLNLTYGGGQKCNNGIVRKTQFMFVCNYSSGVGFPEYEKETGCGFYHFIWKTKYACLPKIAECSATGDDGKVYDLSMLSVSDKNWSYKFSNSTEYYINVCRPLKRVRGCSVFSAICMKNEQQFTDMGEVAESPVVLPGGDLLLKYNLDNGTCGSEIRFVCDRLETLGSIRLGVSTSSCQHSFLWRTVYACPSVDVISKLDTCTLNDSYSAHTFSLMPLWRRGSSYNVSVESVGKFMLNICGDVSGSPCGAAAGGTYSACLLASNGKATVIGTTSKKLDYVNGVVSVVMGKGDFTPSTEMRFITTVKFVCRHNVTEGWLRFEELLDGYNYVFVMETSLVCTPEPVECRMRNGKGELYDLEPLKKSSGFWNALNSMSDSRSHGYIINVCAPITNAPAGCEGPVGACQTLIKEKRAFNLGYVQSSPRIFDKVAALTYLNGDEGNHNGALNRSSHIFFHCSQVEGSPRFQLENRKTYEYVFNWLTPVACPASQFSGTSCKVTDGQFGLEYDLSALTLTDYTVKLEGAEIVLRLCGKVTSDAACGGSACLKKGSTTTNIGDVNDTLVLFGSFVSAVYTRGSITTSISFVCSDVNANPYLASSSAERYEIEWKTRLVCMKPPTVECSVRVEKSSGEEHFDLSLLSRLTANWQAAISKSSGVNGSTQAFINVCRPLVRREQVKRCKGTSALCLINGNSVIDLGHMIESPSVASSGGNILLKFVDGDICGGDNSRRYSATIELTKADQGLGEPVLERVDGCNYIFVWSTMVAHAINSGTVVPKDTCTVKNIVTGYEFDLTPLRGNRDYRVDDRGDGYFKINVCGPLLDPGNCSANSSVCLLSKSNEAVAVTVATSTKLVRHDRILYTVMEGATCARCNCSYATIINFVCDAAEEIGVPQFVSDSESDCLLVFVWRTAHACEPVIECAAFDSSSGNSTALDPLMMISTNYKVQIPSFVKSLIGNDAIYINICRDLNALPMCPVGAAACRVGAGKSWSLGSVTNKPEFTTSGDLLLTYEDGSACVDNSESRYQSKIKFRCDKYVDKAVVALESIENSCVYHFVVTSSLVCRPEEPVVDSSNCTVKIGRRSFDLSKLKRGPAESDYAVHTKSSAIKFFINVCAVTTVNDAACSGAAVCKEDKTNPRQTGYRGLGLVKFQSWREGSAGSLLLSYGKDNTSAVSEIKFICDRSVAAGQPTLAASDDTPAERSSYHFEWLTGVVCPMTLSNNDVLLRNGMTFDLGVLNKVYRAKTTTGETDFYVNVGGYLVDNAGDCPPASFACLKRPAVVRSIGGERTFVAENDAILLSFTSGDCTTRVKISCDPSKVDSFTLTSSDDDTCLYVFSLLSSSFCDASSTAPPTTPKPTESTNSLATQPGVSLSGRQSIVPATVVGIVSIMAALFLILFVVLLKDPVRRSSFKSTCAGLVCCRPRVEPPVYKYQELSALDSDVEMLDSGPLHLEDTSTRPVANSITAEPNGPAVYRDEPEEDSDEELLRL